MEVATDEINQAVENSAVEAETIERGDSRHCPPNRVFHPACSAFPEMPDAELNELAADIKANGLLSLILRWRGQILDGRNRLRACEIAGVEPKFKDVDDKLKDDAAVWSTVYSLNLHRRHLTPKDRARLIEDRIKVTPEISNRQIATETGTSDKTVAAHRAKLERTAEIPQLKVTTGKDGKRRPARKGPRSGHIADLSAFIDKHGIPEVIGAFRAGKVGGADAAKIAQLSKPEQEKAVRALPHESADAAAEPMPADAEVTDGRRRKVVDDVPNCIGMQFARMAIRDLEQIRADDTEKAEAWATVRKWLDEHEHVESQR